MRETRDAADGFQHVSVLLEESVDLLITDPDGFYVDGTYGRGGHSRAILRRLGARGRLMVFDKDAEAIANAHELAGSDGRLRVVHRSFADMAEVLQDEGQAGSVAGILLDLGVSSPQLDDAERGFSFTRDGPLDMRMDQTRGRSAAEWVESVTEKDLEQVLKEYGEERYAKRIARSIIEARKVSPISRTRQLADIVAKAHPAWEKGKHPATRAFQAIRIAVNRELDDLATLLKQVVDLLAPGGRLVVISFHSLEDRMVKRFMQEGARGPELPRGLPIREDQIRRPLRLVGKAIKASNQEVGDNVRSRSAVLRVAEKVG